MKKLLIVATLGMIGAPIQCQTIWGQCNSFSGSSTIIVNGAKYSCNGSSSVIDGTVYCNGIQISSNGQNHNSHTTDSGKTETKHFPIKDIRRISAATMGNVFIEQCQDPQNCLEELILTADSNMFDKLQHNTYGGELSLNMKGNQSFSTKTPIQYHVRLKNLDQISNVGLGSITTSPITTDTLAINALGNGTIHIQKIIAKKLKVKSSGNSDIRANLDVDILEVDQSGHSALTFDGRAHQQEIDQRGNADYNGKKLESSTTFFSASGTSNLHVNAKEKIKGNLSGNASGTYNKKHAPDINVKVSGIARFEKSSW